MLTTSLTLPDVFGAKTPKANCANLRTKGWEITLSWQDEFQLAGSPFSYNVSASVGDYITKITKYHNPDRLISDHYVGKTLGEIWGYHVEGLFKTDREAAEYQATIDDKAVNNRVYQCKGPAGNYLRAGDVRFADLDGDNVISEGSGTVDDPGRQAHHRQLAAALQLLVPRGIQLDGLSTCRPSSRASDAATGIRPPDKHPTISGAPTRSRPPRSSTRISMRTAGRRTTATPTFPVRAATTPMREARWARKTTATSRTSPTCA